MGYRERNIIKNVFFNISLEYFKRKFRTGNISKRKFPVNYSGYTLNPESLQFKFRNRHDSDDGAVNRETQIVCSGGVSDS